MLCIEISVSCVSEHIDIYATCDEFICVSAENNDYIDISAELVGNIIVYAVYEPDSIIVSATGFEAIVIYSSYVCTISSDGYLYIKPESITITPVFSHPVINVISNLYWEIIQE